MNALEFFKSLPKDIKNKIAQYMVAGAMSINSVEKKSLSATGDQAYTGDKMQHNYIKNNLLAALKEGRVTKETEQYKRYFYDVLEKAEEYAQKMNPGQMQLLVEHAMGDDELSEQEKSILLKKIKTFDNSAPTIGEIDRRKAESRTTSDDDFPLEFIVNNNKVETNSIQVTLYGAKPEYEYALKCSRDYDNEIYIEDYTDSLHVKSAPNNEKILEFFIPTYKIRFDETDPIFNDMVSIKSVDFVNHVGVQFHYNIVGFYKIIRINQSTVIKFIARGGRLSR
jgi:hypothetical protein